jgi:hypothetical protein
VPVSRSSPLSLVTRLRRSLRRARHALEDGAVADGEARFWGAGPPAGARPPSGVPGRVPSRVPSRVEAR